MNIKRLIKESFEDLSWIRDSKATLKDKVIEFEPMLNFEEWNQVLNLLINHVVTFDEDIIWWGDTLLDEFQPMDDDQYLHHLIISKDGRMVFGAMVPDLVEDLRSYGWSEDEIANHWEHLYGDIDSFIDGHADKFDSPETIDGREYFNIPYKKPIQESEEFDFINDSPELHGVTFKVVGHDQIYQINDIGFHSYVDITWIRDGRKEESAYKRDAVNKYFRDGTWVVYDGPYSESINESEEWDWAKKIEPKWDSSNIHLVAGKKFYVSGFPAPQYGAYWFEDNIRPKPKKKTRIPMPQIKVCWEERPTKKIKCAGQSRWRIIEKLNDRDWILMSEETIKESEDPLKWIKDSEPFNPTDKKIVLDFKLDSNWGNAEELHDLTKRVLDLLDMFDYDIDVIKRKINRGDTDYCYIFLERRVIPSFNEVYNFTTWGRCSDGELDSFDDIDEFEIMTPTEFLDLF